MDTVLRGLATYFVVWLIFRVSGKRSLAEITTFDFVLLLIISETTQNALTDSDNSMTGALLLIVTLIGSDIALSLFKRGRPSVEKFIDGIPLVLVEDGQLLKDRMHKTRIDEGDILASARLTQGLSRMDQIHYAILERDGGISIIPRKDSSS